MKEQLISYGAVVNDFKEIARLKNHLQKIKDGKVNAFRVDCYGMFPDYTPIVDKFKQLDFLLPVNVEIFLPSDKYPPHRDNNTSSTSYFIGLESGQFYIEGVIYEIAPFVLYAFDDSKLHNTNFAAIMLGYK